MPGPPEGPDVPSEVAVELSTVRDHLGHLSASSCEPIIEELNVTNTAPSPPPPFFQLPTGLGSLQPDTGQSTGFGGQFMLGFSKDTASSSRDPAGPPTVAALINEGIAGLNLVTHEVQRVIDEAPPLMSKSETERLVPEEQEEKSKCRKTWAAWKVTLHIVKILNIIWMGLRPPIAESADALKLFKFWMTMCFGPVVIFLTLRHWCRETYHPMTKVDDFHIVRTGKPLDRHPPEITCGIIASMIWLGSFQSVLSLVSYTSICVVCSQHTCQWYSYAQIGIKTVTLIFTLKTFFLTLWFAVEVWVILLVAGFFTIPCCCVGCWGILAYLWANGLQRDTVIFGNKCARLYDHIAWFYMHL